ncbi:hypothetical protein AB0903_07895 [Streptomyces sp. NPDC048389]|uniref:hypothetical protein n=1 Tax=Streptomyces sp. NPDC048389 TaxID=3154622 RepID=UPI00345418C5
MCRAHGLAGDFGVRAWTSPRRTPLLYPDAVTLSEEATADDVLAAIDTAGGGCSVKDGFASLDLSGAGFDVLFEARWLYRPAGAPAPAPPPGTAWAPLTTPAELAEWATAWDAGGGLSALFRPGLLADPVVTFLAGRGAGDGRVVAGAVVSLGGGAAGLSNVFAADGDIDAAWAGCLSAVARLRPGTPVVGYEHGDDLAAAVRHGCAEAGPLRVWLSP